MISHMSRSSSDATKHGLTREGRGRAMRRGYTQNLSGDIVMFINLEFALSASKTSMNTLIDKSLLSFKNNSIVKDSKSFTLKMKKLYSLSLVRRSKG